MVDRDLKTFEFLIDSCDFKGKILNFIVIYIRHNLENLFKFRLGTEKRLEGSRDFSRTLENSRSVVLTCRDSRNFRFV